MWMNISNSVHDVKDIRQTYDIFVTQASKKNRNI